MSDTAVVVVDPAVVETVPDPSVIVPSKPRRVRASKPARTVPSSSSLSATVIARIRATYGPTMAVIMAACATIRDHVVMAESAIAADITAVRTIVDAAVPRVPLATDGASNARTSVYPGVPGIAQWQNDVYRANAEPGVRLSDRVLIVAWAVPFPSARCNFAAHPDYIGSTRSLFNTGRHGNAKPDTASVAYDVHGEPVTRGPKRTIRAA